MIAMLAAEATRQELQARLTGILGEAAGVDRELTRAIAMARAAGLEPELVHLANSAAAILRPSARFDAVRCGIATYGLDPAPGTDHGLDLRPAMTVRADLALVKHLVAGESVSYGHQWTAATPTTVGLVPVGYAEGLPVAASNVGEVSEQTK